MRAKFERERWSEPTALIYHRLTFFLSTKAIARRHHNNDINNSAYQCDTIEIPERLNSRGTPKIARLLLSLATECIFPPGSHFFPFNYHAKPSTNAAQYFNVFKLSSTSGSVKDSLCPNAAAVLGKVLNHKAPYMGMSYLI